MIQLYLLCIAIGYILGLIRAEMIVKKVAKKHGISINNKEVGTK